MTIAQIQELILSETGIKTSAKKHTGSMKHHLCFSSMFQNGNYPKFPYEWRTKFVKQFKIAGGYGNYANDYQIDILKINIDEGEAIKYKKESKPKPIELQKVKSWGSENSQMRLDKATA